MNPILRTLFLLVLATVILTSLVAAEHRVNRLPNGLSQIENPSQGRVACQLTDFNGTAAYYFADWPTGRQWIQYFDPTDCGSYPTYPFEITSLDLSLWDDGNGVQWPVEISVVVYSPVDYMEPCSGPGEELCRMSVVCNQADFEYPTVGSIDLDCCVYGTFYIGVEYTDAGPGPFPSVMFDDDTAVDTCDNWIYAQDEGIWYETYDAFDPPPGNPVWWMNGETASSGCTVMDLDIVRTIPYVYDSIQYLEGTEVRVIGEFISDDMPLLVDNYHEYIRDEKMPSNSFMNVTGALPPPDYWYGGQVIVTGTVTSAPNPYPAWDDDTLLITITVVAYDLLDPGYGLEVEPPPLQGQIDQDEYDKDSDLDCDSCKFAILVSSGGRARWNRPDYWENLVALRKHKIDNEGYCPENVFTHFDTGTPEDSTDIPDSLTYPATEGAIDSTHDEISRRVAACRRAGKEAKVQKLFTNHGSDGNGVVLVGAGDGHYLSPAELTAMQQKLIDSGCTSLFDEFITCYGGDMLDGLRGLNTKKNTQVHANSAAPGYAPGWSPVYRINADGDTVYIPHHYLRKKIESLAAGMPYEEAVRAAEKEYNDWLRDRVIPNVVRDSIRTQGRVNHWQYQRNRGDSLFIAGALTYDQWRNWRRICDSALVADTSRLTKIYQRLARLRRQVNGTGDDGTGQGSPSWVRHTFHKYCEWKKFVAPPGGELKIKFEGEGGCGNCTVWEKQTDGTWKRVRVWNWNLPGSYGYAPGNENRVIHVPEESEGVYWIHNDNGEFTITVDSYSGRPSPTESASNISAFAGFSLGSDDESADEFAYLTSIVHTSWGTDEENFNLQDVPAFLSDMEGVSQYTAMFSALEPNEWWMDMELYLNILYVTQPGPLTIECPMADIPMQEVDILEPGKYTVHLGAIMAPSDGLISFSTLGQVGLIWDSWGLRSRVPTWPESECNIRGDIDHNGTGPDIGDLVYLVNYMFNGGPPPPVMEEADIDGNGTGPDIGDLVYLVNYMFNGGPAPIPCP